MSFLRFLIILSLAIWVGGLAFFPVVAQTAFSVLPAPHLAGLVVRRSLIALHWIGLISGVVFLAASLLHNRLSRGTPHVLAAPHIAVALMLLLTLISHFGIIPRMDALRATTGDISSLPSSDAIRVQFDALHAWSTRLEGAVLVLGLVAIFSVARSTYS